MGQTKNDIEILIGRCISGNANKKEVALLEGWKTTSPKNQKTIDESLKVWGNGTHWISSQKIQNDKANIQREMNKSLSLQVRRLKRNSQILKIAAVLVIPIALAVSWLVLPNVTLKNQPAQFCEISAPKGHVSKCTLPDGSEVWVNTNSSISYNTTSFNKDFREIEVNGEAFFKVAINKKIPFKVKNTLAEIVVTGTQFNVKSYPGSKIFETVLAEGSIELNIKSAQNQVIKMVPGERAIFNSKKREINIELVDVELYSSWRNGEILFKDATLNDLIVELERIYDIQFYLEDKDLGNYRFRGMFRYNNNLIDALEKIKKTAGVDYYIENKKVWLKKSH